MSRHGEALDTLRWGDSRPIVFTALAGDQIPPLPIIQLVKAQWRWPLVWGLRVVIIPQLDPTETSTFTVTVQVTLGAGQNSITTTFIYSLAPNSSGLYDVINDFIELPASDIQVTATLSGTPKANNVQENVTIGAYVAPMTEPHAMTEMLEHLRGDAEGRGLRWMDGNPHAPSHTNPGTGISFPVNPDPLTYQPR